MLNPGEFFLLHVDEAIAIRDALDTLLADLNKKKGPLMFYGKLNELGVSDFHRKVHSYERSLEDTSDDE